MRNTGKLHKPIRKKVKNARRAKKKLIEDIKENMGDNDDELDTMLKVSGISVFCPKPRRHV